MVQEITSSSQFQSFINSNKITVVDFFAVWCGPCKMVGPLFEQLASKYTACQFIKVDVDKLQDVAAQCRVSAMPTFQIYRGGQKLHEVVGANISAVENHIINLGAGFQSFSGGGRSLGGGSGVGMAGSTYVNPWADSATFDRKKHDEKKDETEKKEENMDDIDPEIVESLLAKKSTKGRNYLKELKEKQSQSKEGEVPNISDEEKLDILSKSVTGTFLQELLDMGFSKVRAIKALIEVGDSGVSEAIDWLDEHQNDEGIDSIPEFTIETEEQKQSRIKEKIDAVKMQLKENRKLREENSAKEILEREKKRRILGKNTQDSLKKWEEEQRQRERELRKKSDREDKARKKMLKKQIKIDNLNRKLEKLEGSGNLEEIERIKKDLAKLEGKEYQESTIISPTTTPSEQKTVSDSKTTNTNCAIRIRMLDGETITASFSPTDTLNTILQHVQQLSPGNYTIMTPFPRKTYRGSELSTTLEAAGLNPRGNVICTDM